MTTDAAATTDDPSVRPWWQRFPGRLERELAALTAAGFTVLQHAPTSSQHSAEEDTDEVAGTAAPASADIAATMTITVSAPIGGRQVLLRIELGDAYPWLPPAVFAPEETSWHRHREPTTGALCLTAGTTSDASWLPSETAASLLSSQLRLIDHAHHSDVTLEQAAGFEHHAGNALADHARARLEHGLLMDSRLSRSVDGQRYGEAVVMLAHTPHGVRVTPLGLGREAGKATAFLQAPASRLPGEGVSTRWVRLDTVVATEVFDAPDQLWQRALAALPAQLRPDDRAAPTLQLILLAYTDELGHRRTGTSWLLLRRHRQDRRHRWTVTVDAATNVGPDDLHARVPSAAALRDTHVVLVGLGAVGGTVALELARAGLHRLTLVDGDRTDAQTSARQWVRPLWDSGEAKVATIAGNIMGLAPHTRLRLLAASLGAAGTHAALVNALTCADLLIDCAASWPLSRYLAATCREIDRPILVASATGGARGGLVTHLTGTTACWACLEHHRADGTLPVPPALPGDEVLPVGCGLPTFTGTGYDLGHVSLHAVRIAVDLLGGGDGLGGQVHTLSLWRDGRPAPAQWMTAALDQHPACPAHERPTMSAVVA